MDERNGVHLLGGVGRHLVSQRSRSSQLSTECHAGRREPEIAHSVAWSRRKTSLRRAQHREARSGRLQSVCDGVCVEPRFCADFFAPASADDALIGCQVQKVRLRFLSMIRRSVIRRFRNSPRMFHSRRRAKTRLVGSAALDKSGWHARGVQGY